MAVGVGGHASKEPVRVESLDTGIAEKVLMDADFIGNSMAGLNNGVVPIEKEGCTSNVVVPVGFPNTNSPSCCTTGVIPEPTLLVCRHLFDNEAEKAVFISPTVIPSNSFGS